MAGFVDLVEQEILDWFFATRTPTTKYIGLSSTTPTDAGGNVTEPSGGAYVRVSTIAADWGAASGTAPAVKSNTAVKTFAAATANWSSSANQTHFVIFDAASAGNVLAWGALTVAKPVLTGDTPSFAAGALVLKQGDPGDTY